MRIRFILLLLGVLVACSAGAQERPLLGRTVQSVVDELRAAGAPLVYSSAVLPSRLRVEGEPVATLPLALAREILAPHGLAVREEGGVWLIVRAEAPVEVAPARLLAAVQSAYAGVPLTGATVQLDPPLGASVTTVDGRGDLGVVTPGRHTLSVRAMGFCPSAERSRSRRARRRRSPSLCSRSLGGSRRSP